MTLWRVLSVAGVSTPEQAKLEKASVPEQLATNRRWCTENGAEIVKEIVIPGHSRYYQTLDEIVLDCPQYADILKTIRSDDVNLVCCMYTSRLWRTMELHAALMNECDKHAVQVLSTQAGPVGGVLQDPDNYLRRTPMQKLIGLAGSFSDEQEIAVLRERYRFGMKRRTERGLPFLTQILPYGYARDESGELVVVEAEAHWVRWMYERRLSRWGYTRIANTLTAENVPPPSVGRPDAPHPRRAANSAGLWYMATVRRILHQPLYTGIVHHSKTTAELTAAYRHLIIIDREVWRRVQEINQSQGRAHNSSSARGSHMLSSLVRCGLCGCAMTYSAGTGKGPYRNLRCGLYLRSGGRECESNYHYAHSVHVAVLEQVITALQNPRAFAEAQAQDQPWESEQAALQQSLTDLMAQRARWEVAYGSGAIDLALFDTKVRAIRDEEQRLRQRLTELTDVIAANAGRADRLESLAAVVSSLRDMPESDQNEILSRLLKAVYLRRGTPPRLVWV